MPFLVMAFVIPRFRFPVSTPRNARLVAVTKQVFPKRVAVVSQIAKHDAILLTLEQLLGLSDIVDLTGCKQQRDGTTGGVDQRVELCIASAFGDSKRLFLSPANRICASLKHFDMGGVNDAQFATRPLGHNPQGGIPNLPLTPEPKASVDGLPWPEAFGKISPRAAGSHPIEEGLQHKIDWTWRATTLRSILVNALQPLRSIFLSAAEHAATNENDN